MDEELLSNLIIAKGAAYDHHENQHDPTCLLGTRVDILSDIMRWAQDTDETRIFWLSGMAGTGKSTISRTVAKRCDETGILGASFFFKRGEGNRSNTSLFFSTLASQLVHKRPALQAALVEAIQNTKDICSKGVYQQYHDLVLTPLRRNSSGEKMETLTVIIDALDECTTDQDIALLVPLLYDLARSECRKLKLFITSRPATSTLYAQDTIDGHYREVLLQEVTRVSTQQDIERYISHELPLIGDKWNMRHRQDSSQRLPPGWPSEHAIKTLVELSNPLFIFAATACRFIETPFESPEKQLERLVESVRESGVSDRFGPTYLPALRQFDANGTRKERRDRLEKFRAYVGTIILLEDQLPISCIASLIDAHTTEVQNIVCQLGSVLDLPSHQDFPIKLFHQSFREFLVGEEAGAFRIDYKETHQRIALGCLAVMSDTHSLRYNMCNLSPGGSRSDIDPQALSKNFSPHLRYSCCYLVHHLEHSGMHLTDAGSIGRFLKTHLLHWLEALSILGEVSKATEMADGLLRLARVSIRVSLALQSIRMLMTITSLPNKMI